VLRDWKERWEGKYKEEWKKREVWEKCGKETETFITEIRKML